MKPILFLTILVAIVNHQHSSKMRRSTDVTRQSVFQSLRPHADLLTTTEHESNLDLSAAQVHTLFLKLNYFHACFKVF